MYLLAELHGTQFGGLGLGVHHDIEHGAYGLRNTEVCGAGALLQLHLKGCSGSETTQWRINSTVVIQKWDVKSEVRKQEPNIESFFIKL